MLFNKIGTPQIFDAPSLRPVSRSPRYASAGRGTEQRLIGAIMALCSDCATLVHHKETAWASITFSGKRHTLKLKFEGLAAISVGERLIEVLPDHEFVIPGKLVADATVVAVDHCINPDQCLEVTIEILLLDDL